MIPFPILEPELIEEMLNIGFIGQINDEDEEWPTNADFAEKKFWE